MVTLKGKMYTLTRVDESKENAPLRIDEWKKGVGFFCENVRG